jgi:hypothetical protein
MDDRAGAEHAVSSLHRNIPGKETAYGLGTDTHLDLSAAFHEYAVDWGRKRSIGISIAS